MFDQTPTELAASAARDIAHLTGVDQHDIAVTLGSGWRRAAEHLGTTVAEIPAEQVTGFRTSPVQGHTGTLRSVRMDDGTRVLVVGARTHFYEGHGVAATVHGVRTAAAAGVKTMILTNGAGSVDPERTPGDAILIKDHINLTAQSPLVGATFIDLTDLYSQRLRDVAHSVAPDLDEAIYMQLTGPHYETPTEVKMLRGLGGDIVGMSTALEAIAAREAGMEVLGLSLITNLAAGIQQGALSHQEVLDTGKNAEATLGPLLARIISAVSSSR
ncbi:purine-nucleoside phosphorylase [Microbacterium sp. ZW CA_36]|uniref:purine-nucleoside phosphorylase n=1 Tax=Microbacterium sp. ZW CA_36 TaxID=3378078 RepID=UPI003851C026